jgi:serine/threonine-protein kinase mTOR
MSMVGYILGLGDRHPSNLMLDRFTGKILHIDFGDCFEVAMQRDKFPERVPFRLTRMLVNAMEVYCTTLYKSNDSQFCDCCTLHVV